MNASIFLKDLQLMEIAFLALNEQLGSSHTITFLVKVFDELVECNSVPASTGNFDQLIDLQKLHARAMKLTNKETLTRAVQYLFDNPDELYAFLYADCLNKLLLNDEQGTLKKYLYNSVLLDSHISYDFLAIPENEQIQVLSLKISAK